MADTYYDSELSGQEIEAALTAINGVISPTHNGKVLAVENGKIVPKSVSEYIDVPILEPINIIENGDYYPSGDIDGYDEIHVNIESDLESLTVEENGDYYPEDSDGFYEVHVNIPQPPLQAKSTTVNGIVRPDSGYYGLSMVNVNVSGGGGSSEGYGLLSVKYPAGEICTVTDGITTLTAKDTSGSFIFAIPYAGTWTVIAGEKSKVKAFTESPQIKKADMTLPEGFTRVEYVADTTDKQWVDTGLTGSNDLYGIVLEYEPLSTENNSWIFGNYNGNASVDFLTGFYYSKLCISWFGTLYYSDSPWLQKHIVKMNIDGKTTVDGVTIVDHNITGNRTGNLRIFDTHSNSSTRYNAKCRFYSCKIYVNGVLERDFIPAIRDSDSKVGFIDMVNGTFYGNGGYGNLIAGPEE